jgi:hypothetical protein
MTNFRGLHTSLPRMPSRFILVVSGQMFHWWWKETP